MLSVFTSAVRRAAPAAIAVLAVVGAGATASAEAVAVDVQGRAGEARPFVEGWLQVDPGGRESVRGRPADVLPVPDGSLLVSDDFAGAIYRVRYAP